ncbi:thiamine phosphate synthase [Aminipila butyrica]|uniref:Thiamine-phosphate synthase n=1 Tax=Aminipila butyrica TaxID=433296 RepID=A0A858BUK5_9FIRM|nr:thiamine phosphate synthase [Aminipila butyrica]QIB69731.1 thiamine phosphate synthase [Aminipila butyrica]
MQFDKNSLLLYGVTDRSWLKGKHLSVAVEEALKGGTTCLQLREKSMPDDEFLAEALEIKALCHKFGVPFIINDHVQIALDSKADGIHVGQRDMNAQDVRSRIGENMLLGVSVSTVAHARAAEKSGADYLGVGAVFSTSTKADADAVSLETVGEICHAVKIPVVAIGGIAKENLHQLTDLGLAGVALVSAIFAQPDIRVSCLALRELAEKWLL